AHLLSLARHAVHSAPATDRDRSFGQNHQTPDEIAGDSLQPKPDPPANRARENRQRAEMNAGIFQNNQNTNYQHDVGDDLGNGVLEGTIQSAIDEKPIEKKPFRPGGDPKARD